MSMLFARRRDKFNNDREENYCSYRMAIALHERYIREYGSITCLDIHNKIFGRSFDFWKPEQTKLLEEAVRTRTSTPVSLRKPQHGQLTYYLTR